MSAEVENSPRNINRRDLLKLASLSIGGAILSACTLPEEQSWINTSINLAADDEKITVWAWAGTYEGLITQIDAFNQIYPHIKVDLVITGYDDTHINLLNSVFAGRGAPDICAMDVFRLAELADSLVDITEFALPYKDLFIPPTFEVATYQGKTYGLATDSQPVGLYYRKDMFEQYGINPEDIRVWEDFIEIGKKITQSSNGRIKSHIMSSGDSLLFEVMAVEQGFRGYYFNDDDTRVIVDDPLIVESIEMIRKMWAGEGILRNPQGGIAGDEANVVIKANKLATQIVGPAWYRQVLNGILPEQSGNWRLMRVPAMYQGGPRIGYNVPTIFVITKQSKFVKQSWDLCRLTLTGDGAKVLYEKTGILPAYAPLLDEIIDQPVDYFGGQEINRLYTEIAEDTPHVFYGKGFLETRAIIGKHMDEILYGIIDPHDGMRNAANELRVKLGKG